MQCLYCGKQLALLRRLTGGGEFCSDAHKQQYQEEYNRLALSRLLQAQSKPGEIKTKANAPVPAEGLGQPLPPGSARHRALSSSSPESEPRSAPSVVEPPRPAPQEPVQAVQTPIEEPTQPIAAEAPVETESEPAEVEETTPDIAGFSLELPVFAWLADGIPYVEPYLEASASAVISSWQPAGYSSVLSLASPVPLEPGAPVAQNALDPLVIPIGHAEFGTPAVDLSPLADRAFKDLESGAASQASSQESFSSLPSAGLLPIRSDSFAAKLELRAMDVVAQPTEFSAANWNRNVPFAVDTPMPRVFPAASAVSLELGIARSRQGHPSSLNGTLNFPVGVVFQDSSLLLLSPAGIDFPAEDAEVILAAPWAERLFSNPDSLEQPVENGVAVMEPSTPRESLEALSRLHEELAAAQEESQSIASVEAAPADVEVLEAPAQLQAAEPATGDAPAPTIEVHAEPVQEAPVPRPAHELLEIPLKTFAPPKPAIMMEADALVNLAPQAPQLKALPLRPKVAKAPPGFSPQSGTTVATKSPATEPAAKAPAPATPAPATSAPPRPEVRTKQIPATKGPAWAAKTSPRQDAKPGKAAPLAKPAESAAPAADKAPFKEPAKPATPTAPPAQPAQPPQVQRPEINTSELSPAAKTVPEPETMPSFATLQPRKKVPFLASLKLKLTIAIVLVGSAATFLIVHNGKAPATSPAKPSHAAENVIVGPSIMMGEGGWVQGWSGDVNGSHAGRQITIYRPSLKLSDYRIEFQAEIDSKSVGWVFRALDPYNYYAAKLAIASPASAGHFSLIKYMVQQGHETELGRTLVNIDASAEAVLNVRMDVCGSTFRTYVQGQAVDVWTDEHFKSGGAGFLNERAERARVKSVSIFYLTGGKN